MGAQVPLIMALDDPGAVPVLVGGKGASLARLVRAGFRVPPGFHVTTRTYLDFAERTGLREAVPAALSAVDPSDAATLDATAARIGELFAGHPLPAQAAAAIAGAYASLGDAVPVAVRSSATVEDLPGLSAAGQHDTYLNVRGEAAVLDAVRRCWASLWSARAIGYRARRGLEPGDVSIAVVVQWLVPAEAAGVMFTTDPVDGARDTVVVSANWGLGESVVAGDVTPDVAVVDRTSGTLVSYQAGSKETMTVADGTATRAAGTPPGLRAAAVLSPGQAGELARVGLAIEKLYGEPMDVEWALAAGELYVVQARPITSLAAGPGEQWNDSLAGDYLWSNGNLGEALPDVMTPATWSFVELLMSRMTFPPSLPGYRGYGRIGGRLYTNVSMSISLEALARLARGEIDRGTFARQYGHRGPHEVELSIPRPAEDPAWIDDQLAALSDTARDADALLASTEAARAAAWERLERQDPGKAAAARKLVARWAPLARDREAARSEIVRSVWVARTWVQRAGALTGHGDDLFFLELPETFGLLGGDRAPLAAVPARRVSYQAYRALPPYPALIRGRFDPIRWAADPNRRSDYYDERAQTTEPQDTITGFPGAAGVVEGIARILRTAEDAGRLGDGEILVTTVTNIGWTPVFPRAAAVVTDVGAPLSHAAIVARELGLPAVVGCGNATVRLHTGDRVRVDGSRGTVELLHRAGTKP